MGGHADSILDVVLSISQTSSPALNDVAGSVLASALIELTSPRLRLDSVPHTSLPGLPGVAAWLQGRGGAVAQPRWRTPSGSEQAAAAAIARRAAAAAAAGVAALTAEGRLDSAEPAARQMVHRALVLAFAVSEGLLAAVEPPLLSEAAVAARATDAEHALTLFTPPVDDRWRDCPHYGEALDLALVVLEKASESGTTNATVALSLVEVRVAGRCPCRPPVFPAWRVAGVCKSPLCPAWSTQDAVPPTEQSPSRCSGAKHLQVAHCFALVQHLTQHEHAHHRHRPWHSVPRI